MKKWNRVLPLAVTALLLGGCGEAAVDVTTVAIQKDGTIRHTMVEAFGEESVDELQSMMEEKAAEYNGSNSASVSVDTVSVDGDVVRVVMTYPDAASFDGFMNMDVVAVDPALRAPFFYGTVEEALMQGYDLETALQGVDTEETLQGKSDLLTRGENRIIIYDNEMNLGEPVQISTQEKPLYVSSNVTVLGKNLVEISGDEGLAYILLES